MNYLEIIGKNLVHVNCVQDYIDWAVLKLEQGFEIDSIIALVSLLLEIFPDVDIAETYFSQSIEEIGLLYPSDKEAIYAYLQFYCDEVTLGKVEPEYAVSELTEICEKIQVTNAYIHAYHPIMDIWYFLTEDLTLLSWDEFSYFNTGLNNLNIDHYIIQIIHQFKLMLALDLPEKFVFSSISEGHNLWEMRDFEGRVQYLKDTSQNLIFKP